MQNMRTLIWVVFAVLLTLFAAMNSEVVAVRLFPGAEGTVAEMPLALLIISVFLLGFLPPYLVNMTNRWRLQRKIKQQDDTIAMLRPTPAPTPPAPVIEPSPTPLSTTDSAL
jgi:lipopolysaccharide assembly protein A